MVFELAEALKRAGYPSVDVHVKRRDGDDYLERERYQARLCAEARADGSIVSPLLPDIRRNGYGETACRAATALMTSMQDVVVRLEDVGDEVVKGAEKARDKLNEMLRAVKGVLMEAHVRPEDLL